VVVHDKVVVHRLGDVDAAHVIAGRLRVQVDDAHRVGAVVAADVEEVPHVVGLADLEHLAAVLLVRLVAGGKEGAGGGHGNLLQVVSGFLREVEEVLVDDAAHAVCGAIDPRHLGELPRFEHGAHEGLIDDRRGAAALRDQDLACQFGHSNALFRSGLVDCGKAHPECPFP